MKRGKSFLKKITYTIMSLKESFINLCMGLISLFNIIKKVFFFIIDSYFIVKRDVDNEINFFEGIQRRMKLLEDVNFFKIINDEIKFIIKK